LVCFSHLRWNFVFQRPQHLMTRLARGMAVHFFEEPLPTDAAEPWLEAQRVEGGVRVLTPRLPAAMGAAAAEGMQRALLDRYLAEQKVAAPLLWYYTPMALGFSAHVEASRVVYDCMDELSAFRDAPPRLVGQERRLMERADLVFTGGRSLYEAKRTLHPRVHAFPSSVDVAHFRTARRPGQDPADQAALARPRLGFYGVLDERLDLDLLAAVAGMRPAWQLVMVGPVAKIDPATLPRLPNIHYLGQKGYAELPRYLAGWDVALMPFALNESTRFISPTKTPEYLAGGRPVVSTPIVDVAAAYAGLVGIAATPEDFVREVEAALRRAREPGAWLEAVDRRLADMSWDETTDRMRELFR
jgi:UDP-galactopyranose mutase